MVLGSTIKSLDTRKELVNYIGGNTEPSRAVVTNSGGEIGSSVVALAELAHLSGITSNVQTQIGTKQATITGAATTVTSANLTSSRVLLSGGSGKISASDATATTFAYLDPTSSIQGQLDGKHPEITTSAPLSQNKINGLANTLPGKQPTISSTTNLVVAKVTFGAGLIAWFGADDSPRGVVQRREHLLSIANGESSCLLLLLHVFRLKSTFAVIDRLQTGLLA